MKNADDILDETLGILDPVEKELGIQKMLTPVISRPSEEKEHIDMKREDFEVILNDETEDIYWEGRNR